MSEKTETFDLQAAKAQVAAMPHDIRVVTRHSNGESETYVERPSVEAYRAMRKMLPACIAEVERLRALLAEVWDIAEARECVGRHKADPACGCDRLRQIGEQESAP